MSRLWSRPSRITVVGACVAALLLPACAGVSGRTPHPRIAAAAAGGAAPIVSAPAGPCDLSRPAAASVPARELLANRYTLASFPTFTLPRDPRWNENPAHDPNWEFNFHSLRFAEELWRAWDATHDRRYLNRYEFVLRDWYRDNQRNDPPSRFSWNDHSTAWRGIVYACALRRLPGRPWLRAAALLHGRTLADPAFYKKHGNHALNQSIGLLELGCELHRKGWRTLAQRRIERLVVESIDAQGATNEQSIGYEWYNDARYSAAIAALNACGMTPSRSLIERVRRMPAFLAFGALPDARWELVGDTVDDRLKELPGTVAQFVASGGARGIRPSALYATFRAGFAFLRSGWGTDRPLVDETAVCVRFGPARAFHGHRDAASVTLYANGDRILLDPGYFHYARDAWRAWFRSGPAHNTIDVEGSPMTEAGTTDLVAERHAEGFDFLALRDRKIPGVDHRRRVLYSRRLGVLLVEDDITASTPRTVRQWWHLHPEARPAYAADGFFTGRAGSRANAWVVQLDGPAHQRAYRGSTDPIQGWVSFGYGQRQAAPAVAVSKTGTHVRFFTLIVPSAAKERTWTVRSFATRTDGFDLVLDVGGLTEAFTVRGADAVARSL
jgi:heparinase II/III-like protein